MQNLASTLFGTKHPDRIFPFFRFQDPQQQSQQQQHQQQSQQQQHQLPDYAQSLSFASSATSQHQNHHPLVVDDSSIPKQDTAVDFLTVTLKSLSVSEKEDVVFPPDDNHNHNHNNMGATTKELQQQQQQVQDINTNQNEDFREQCLLLFDLEINKIPIHLKYAYETAKQINSEYVTNRKFKLQFLQAVNYNISAATKRMIKFFDIKLELFGTSKLTKSITQNDLSYDDIQCLKSGFCQLLPMKDVNGRSIIVGIPWLSVGHVRVSENKLRSLWYILECALRGDEESLKKGCIAIFYPIGPKVPIDKNLYWKVGPMTLNFPIRWHTLHVCSSTSTSNTTTTSSSPGRGIHSSSSSSSMQQFVNLVSKLYESHTRRQLKCHFGTNMECIYALMTMGIPTQCFPVSETGALRLIYHINFLEQQRIQEETIIDSGQLQISSESSTNNINIIINANKELVHHHHQNITQGVGGGGGGGGLYVTATGGIVNDPDPLDILLGRGRVYREHPGNVRFHHVIELNMERYEHSNKNQKQVLTDEVVERIKASGSRFLKKNKSNGSWIISSDIVAREKVSHSFRNRRTINTTTTTTNMEKIKQSQEQEKQQIMPNPNKNIPPSILSRPLDTPSCCMPLFGT